MAMQVCSRSSCDRPIHESDTRMLVDGRVYHYYCGWKVQQVLEELVKQERSELEEHKPVIKGEMF